MEKRNYKRVLSVAGSDSGGGAGIQADVKTISACGCYAATAITAVTVQNTLGVRSVYGMSGEAIEGQMEAVLSDIGVDSMKTGMLFSADIVRVVAKMIRKYDVKNFVLDPVMVSTSGHKLIDDEAIDVLRKELLPLAKIITPNIPEAEMLFGCKISKQEDLPEVAVRMAKEYGTSIYLKAGHLTETTLTDVFFNAETSEIETLSSKRIETANTHGTGCTLSSALASGLALGHDLSETAKFAHDYLSAAIEKGAVYKIGGGFGPVHHFWKYWE
jgi:hydroxymethylpyrimidine/phosphomethylpyrimidine kinase